MASDWVDGSDLASMSRGGNVIEQMGYDPDKVRMNPGLRAEVMSKLAGPYAPTQMAQNQPPAPPSNPNPRSQNGNSIEAPPGQPRLFNRVQPSAPQLPVPSLGPTSSAVSPSGTTTPSIETQNSRQAAGNLLAPEPALPDTSAQDSMIAAKSVPLNPNNPMYKEGLAGKIGRGFKAAAVGFARGGVPASIGGAADPSLVGEAKYGDPNSDFQIDDKTRQAQLDLANKQKVDVIDRFKRAADLRKQQDTASNDAGTISNVAAKLPNETTSANAQATDAKASVSRAYNDSPQGKAEAARQLNTVTLADRQTQLADPKNPLSKASTADKAYFTATGKLPDPDRYHAPAEQILFDKAHSAWVAEHPGKTPGLKDIQDMVQATKGDPGAKSRDANTEKEYMAAQKDLSGQFSAAQQQNEALTTAQQELASGAVGQAVGTVKTMVGLAGGKGTGVRITQAELNAIASARGIKGDFEGYINGLAGKGKLSSDQITEIQGLLGDVADKVKEKMGLQDTYLDKLAQAKSVDDVRDVQSQYRKEFTGGGSSTSSSGFKWDDHPVVK